MASPSNKQWDAARVQLREWLAEHSLSQSELARLAGVHRSVVHRFLERDRPLSDKTAARLYNVLKLNLGATDRTRWIEWLNLGEATILLGESPGDRELLPTIPRHPNITLGYDLLRKAWSLVHRDDQGALTYFAKAERAFGPLSSMAALAACDLIELLIFLGDLSRADLEVFRVEHAYQGVMDVQTRARFLYWKGMVAYDGRDFPRALRATNDLLVLGQIYDFSTTAEHLVALVQLGMAERMTDADLHKQPLLAQAESNMRLMVRYFKNDGNVVNDGFQYFRLAQILREQGRKEDAQYYRKLAQQCFHGTGAILHTRLEDANLALLNGQTKRARLNASAALEMAAPTGYAGGAARAAGVIALSLRMEGRYEDALDSIVMAASLAPYESFFKGGRFTNLVQEIKDDLIRQDGLSHYKKLIASLQQRLERRSGYFESLNYMVPDRSGRVNELMSKL